MLNAPYNGGTHLPDITVVTPVFDEDGDDILFWVGLPRPPRRRRRQGARLHARRSHPYRRGRRAHRQLQAWSTAAPSAEDTRALLSSGSPTPAAMSIRTWPT
jgi:hypothetical protein